MNTKKLKQLVLDLAIHGKLVPQDPNDEPASELLARIRADVETHGRASNKSKGKKSAVSSVDLEVPFEVPEGWCWCRMQDVIRFVNGRAYKRDELLTKGKYKVLRVGNFFTNDSWYFSDLELEDEKYCYDGDLLYAWSAFFGPKIWKGEKTIFHYHIWNVKYEDILYRDYLYYYLEYDKKTILDSTTGSTMIHIAMEHMNPRFIAIPPLAEQHRIVAAIEKWFAVIDQLEKNEADLKKSIEQTKKKVLDLAIRGKLVAQNPEDEPAGESIKRINPKAEILFESDEYGEVPEGWCLTRLESFISYEQPQKYIVGTTKYSDRFNTPVLTAGKSFILGYTNEENNIFKDVPVIIFDDFTTDSRYVDFEFKVKSSAMKILHVNPIIDAKYISYYMSITRLIGDTHKRFWISEYSKILAPLPPLAEQKRIVEKIEEVMGCWRG